MPGRIEHTRWRVPGLEHERLRQAEVRRALDDALRGHATARDVLGVSAEGRPIERVTVGHGAIGVLAWSQMHGNEPAGTMALVDVLHFLAAAEERVALRITDALHLVAVPMLNPDGAERFERRNAQGIDPNRDALALATPELRLLVSLYEELSPSFALSLHDQEPRKRVGASKRRTAFSVSAPSFDPVSGGTGASAQIRAKQVFADIRDRVAPLVDDRLTRYQAPYEPRAVCDNFQSRGTSTLLFEAAAWENDAEKQYLRSVYFHALVAALDSIATGSWQKADVDDYGALAQNGDEPLADLVVRGGVLCIAGMPEFAADLAIRYEQPLRLEGAVIQDVGDLRDLDGAHEIDATGRFLHVDRAALEDGALRPGCRARIVARAGPGKADPVVWRIDGGGVLRP